MRAPKAMPPLEVLDEWFIEEPAGVLRWRKDYLCWNTTKRAGEIAGTPTKTTELSSAYSATHIFVPASSTRCMRARSRRE
jgi:hypothetical protein